MRRILIAFLLLGGMLSAPASAEDTNAPSAAKLPDFSKPHSHIPNLFFPFVPGGVPPPNFNNTDRMGRVIKDGKLLLSLNDAIALALENNLDLVIARYNLSIADTDVLRTKSGAGARSVDRKSTRLNSS